ncbi:MAG: tetratricopeptide repeat protein [Nibricoccus sp.]
MKNVVLNDAPLPARSRRDCIAWFLIFACCVLVYFPALNGTWLWDDDGHVCKQSLRSLHGLFRIWTDLGATQQYYPILHTAFWVEWFLWGESLLGYHLTNVLLHATAACLVIAIVRRLALPGAWLAGLLFALHPVCVESVAWISEQKNTLSTVFVLGAVLLYLRFDENRTKRHYTFACLLFACALLTKSVTAMVPIALVITFWWKRGRLGWREDILPLLPWVVAGASAGLFTAWVERTYIGAQGSDYLLSPAQRLLLAGRIPWFYLSKLVWPTDLIFIYPRWSPDATVIWQWFFPAALATVIAGLWLLQTRYRGPLAALLAYLALLFPVLGFVNIYPFAFSFVADHFQYLASLAIIIPVASMLARMAQRFFPEKPRWLASLPAAALLAILGLLTWRQSHLYRDNEVLYKSTLALNPRCWLAYNNLGSIINATPGRSAEAIACYKAALAIKPNHPEANFNIANILGKNPATAAEAIGYYEAALQAQPTYTEAHNNLGSLLANDPNYLLEAISHFEEAIRLQPDFTAAHNNLGTALARAGRPSEAIRYYRIAAKLDPSLAETHFNLGNALAKNPSSHVEAIACYEEAIRLQPRYAEAHVNLGVLLSQIPERRADAIAHYEAALRERPDLEAVKRALDRLKSVSPSP